MLWQFMKLLWRPNSEQACIMCIMVSNLLDADDCKELYQYFKALTENKSTGSPLKKNGE